MEVAVINDVVLKLIVANLWRYVVVLLFSLACYRHPDLPPKPLNELQAVADFITFHVPERTRETGCMVFYTPGITNRA